MLFNSFAFPAFFVLVYGAYVALHRNYRAQNIVLLIASYIFYGAWDWRFLFLMAASTVSDFVGARVLEAAESEERRRSILLLLLSINLAVLGFFKYFGFFVENLARALQPLGLHLDEVTLKVILPVGISFYTFHEISYILDVYWRRVKASQNVLEYALFVSFFPLLVAGPIARAAHLLPQMREERFISADRVDEGLFLILWGFFKKLVIADNAGAIADRVFNNYTQFHGLDVVVGALAFTLQIYGDFSGYSDIARGVAALMGFDININFNLPYFARNPSDFWTRWHISLSSWLRDYLYIPLGGSRKGSRRTYLNLLVTMLLGGLWHGAAWNFVLWGGYHGAILGIYRRASEWRGTHRRISTAIDVPVQIAVMFVLTVIGWILFRSRSLSQVLHMFGALGFGTSDYTLTGVYALACISIPLVAMQMAQYRSGDLLVVLRLGRGWRVVTYSGLVFLLFVFGVREATEFIYFQF